METKEVIYHGIFQKVENLDTDEVNTFKVVNAFYGKINESEDGTEISVPLEDGSYAIGKTKYKGRLGIKIAYAKVLRKVLKMLTKELEEDAEEEEARNFPDCCIHGCGRYI